MTQDYEPIELDENTTEPTADGIYLLTITMGDGTRTYPTTKGGGMWLTDDYYTWKDLLSEMSQADRVTIKSLAAHDAEIRDKALALTDDELSIAEGAYESSIMECESDGLGAMSIALKAVAEYRRKQ
jgi:hypothetical protein